MFDKLRKVNSIVINIVIFIESVKYIYFFFDEDAYKAYHNYMQKTLFNLSFISIVIWIYYIYIIVALAPLVIRIIKDMFNKIKQKK